MAEYLAHSPKILVLKEHVERVFHQYEVREKSFRSTLFWLLTFTAFFLFLVLFPYLSIQHELLVLPERLSRTEAEIKAREGRIEAFRRSQEGFERLSGVIRSGPDEMRTFLGSLSLDLPMPNGGGPAPPPMSAQQMDVQQMDVQQMNVQQAPEPDACAGLAGDEGFGCRVLEHLRGRFDGYRDLLEAEVTGPLLAAGGAGAPLADPSRLREEIDRLEARFEARIAENPTFWRAYEEKGEFFVELEGDIAAFWQDYERLIAAQSEVLEREKAELTAAQARLRGDLADMEQLKGELKTRLDAIDTPFGKLPVGLNEAILGFPVLIAIGFLICMRQLADTARLRGAFATLYRRRDPQGRLLSRQQIALIAPLWLDADAPGRPRALAVLTLAAPLVIFLIAVAAVAYSWLETDAFRTAGTLNLRIFAGLYGLSLLAFLMGAMDMRRAVGDAREAAQSEGAEQTLAIPAE